MVVVAFPNLRGFKNLEGLEDQKTMLTFLKVCRIVLKVVRIILANDAHRFFE
jgi:hypothetical protein